MIRVITGSMFAGKTTELLRRLRCAEIAGQKVVLVKPTRCTRAKNKVVTHDGGEFPAIETEWSEPCPDMLAKLEEMNPEVIGVDEAQFLGEFYEDHDDWEEWIRYWDRKGVEVICSCLNQDYRGQTFGFSQRLLIIADDIIHLKAVCNECKQKEAGTRTHRVSGGDEQVQVGGADSYETLCYSCWNKKTS